MAITEAFPVQEEKELDRIQIGHSNVDMVTYDEALDRLTELAEAESGAAQVVTPNAQHIVLLDSDPYLRKIYSEAALVVADGISLVYASRLLGKPLKGRVTGVDLFQGLCGRAAERGLGVFLLGGRRGAAEEAAAKLKSMYPNLKVTGTCCPPWGFQLEEEGLFAVARAILTARPHIVFVALGAPKQEYWIYDHGMKLGVPLSIGIGGSFEMVSGMSRRAPKWIQAAGLEWLYRLGHEPRRLWRRYLVGNVQFLMIIVKQMRAKAKRRAAKQRESEGRA
jgi:N-acetylglucosaminyldiphosphoundecaprenol N-acetyl-beta-D-mannosaminyltransferase